MIRIGEFDVGVYEPTLSYLHKLYAAFVKHQYAIRDGAWISDPDYHCKLHHGALACFLEEEVEE